MAYVYMLCFLCRIITHTVILFGPEWTVSTLVTLSPGEVVCHGFTTGTNQDWPVECFKQNLFPLVLVSEEKTR